MDIQLWDMYTQCLTSLVVHLNVCGDVIMEEGNVLWAVFYCVAQIQYRKPLLWESLMDTLMC